MSFEFYFDVLYPYWIKYTLIIPIYHWSILWFVQFYFTYQNWNIVCNFYFTWLLLFLPFFCNCLCFFCLLILLSIMSSRFVHLVACIRISLPLGWIIFHYMNRSCFVHLSVDYYWIVSTLGILRVLLLWMLMYKYLSLCFLLPYVYI